MKKMFVWLICVMVIGAVAAAPPSCAREGEGEISGEKHAPSGPWPRPAARPTNASRIRNRSSSNSAGELARLADEKTAVSAADLAQGGGRGEDLHRGNAARPRGETQSRKQSTGGRGRA